MPRQKNQHTTASLASTGMCFVWNWTKQYNSERNGAENYILENNSETNPKTDKK
jgi:hypothetical protein